MRSRLLHMTVLFRDETSFLASSAVKPEMFWEVSTTDCLVMVPASSLRTGLDFPPVVTVAVSLFGLFCLCPVCSLFRICHG